MSQQALLYIDLLEAFKDRNQAHVFSTIQSIKKLHEQVKLELIQIALEAVGPSEYGAMNLLRYLASEMSSSSSRTEFKAQLLEIALYYSGTYVVNNAKLACCFIDVLTNAIEAGSLINETMTKDFLIDVQRLLEGTESFKLLYKTFKLVRLTGYGAILKDLLEFALRLLEANSRISCVINQLVDIEDDTHATTFVENEWIDLGWLNLVFINAISAIIVCDISDLHDIIDNVSASPLFRKFQAMNINAAALIFKIFQDDEILLFRTLCHIVERANEFKKWKLLDPVPILETMLLGCDSAESFYQEHLNRNLDCLRFTLLVAKHMNATELTLKDPHCVKILQGLGRHPDLHPALKRHILIILRR